MEQHRRAALLIILAATAAGATTTQVENTEETSLRGGLVETVGATESVRAERAAKASGPESAGPAARLDFDFAPQTPRPATVTSAGLTDLIFANGFELGICGSPWVGWFGAGFLCPQCPASSGLDAAITKQITSLPVGGSCTLTVEIITLTTRPLQLEAVSVVDPGPPVLDTITTGTCTFSINSSFLCKHTMVFDLLQGESGDGDYELTLQGNCNPPLSTCALCSAGQQVDFSLAGTTCPDDEDP